MEAVEGYHAESITAPLKLATYEELRYTHSLIDPLRLQWIGIWRPSARGD